MVKITDKHKHLILIIFCCLAYLFTHYKSFQISFFWDDWEYMLEYKDIIWGESLFKNVFSHHNYHVIPIIKLFYYACFRLFGYSTFPFHLVILFSNWLMITSCYGIVFFIAKNIRISLLLTFILSITHIYDEAILWIGASHILIAASFFYFSLFLLLLNKKSFFYQSLFAGSVFLSFTSFSLGVFLFPFILIGILVYKPDNRKFYFLSTVGSFCVVSLLYFIAIVLLAHTSENNLEQAISVNLIKCIDSLILAFKAIYYKMLPGLFNSSNRIISFIIIFLGFVGFIEAIKKKNNKNIISFFYFFSLMTLSIFIPFFGRIHMGNHVVNWERYYCFPAISFMVCLSLSVLNFLSIRVLKLHLSGKVLNIIISFFMLFLLIISCNKKMSNYPKESLQKQFEFELITSVDKYFSSSKGDIPLKIKDREVKTIFCFKMKASNYFKVFLKKEVYKKINFCNVTSKDFEKFLMYNKYYSTYYLVKT